MDYEILKNVELPTSVKLKKYPFNKLEVGESFFAPDWPKAKGGFYTSVTRYNKNGKKFMGRKMTYNGVEGYMIWRVE